MSHHKLRDFLDIVAMHSLSIAECRQQFSDSFHVDPNQFLPEEIDFCLQHVQMPTSFMSFSKSAIELNSDAVCHNEFFSPFFVTLPSSNRS
jgi:hypothetical protein